MLDRRTLQSWSYAAVGIGGGIALLYLPELLFAAPRPAGDPAFAAAQVSAVVAAMAWAGYFSLAVFRKADEFNRERSKFAWYWGSFLGIAACVLIVAFVRLAGLPAHGPFGPVGRDPFHAFAAGVALPIVAQMLGFGLLILWWRVTRR